MRLFSTRPKKRSEELYRWLRQFDGQIAPFQEDIQAAAKKILVAFPRLVGERKIAFAADPFVIATAMVRDLTVVTEEGPGSVRKPHIPDVCRAHSLDCINLIRGHSGRSLDYQLTSNGYSAPMAESARCRFGTFNPAAMRRVRVQRMSNKRI